MLLKGFISMLSMCWESSTTRIPNMPIFLDSTTPLVIAVDRRQSDYLLAFHKLCLHEELFKKHIEQHLLTENYMKAPLTISSIKQDVPFVN